MYIVLAFIVVLGILYYYNKGRSKMKYEGMLKAYQDTFIDKKEQANGYSGCSLKIAGSSYIPQDCPIQQLFITVNSKQPDDAFICASVGLSEYSVDEFVVKDKYGVPYKDDNGDDLVKRRLYPRFEVALKIVSGLDFNEARGVVTAVSMFQFMTGVNPLDRGDTFPLDEQHCVGLWNLGFIRLLLVHSSDLKQLERYASIFDGVDNTIDLLWLIPIKSDEMQYKREHGTQALIDKINELNVDISSLDRKSVI